MIIHYQADVLVVSCDLITDVALHNVFDMHRTHQASITALFCPMSSDLTATPVPGPKSKHKQGKLVYTYIWHTYETTLNVYTLLT